MALTMSTELRTARIQQIETIAGANAEIVIRTGAPPTNAGLASTGTVLAVVPLGADWATAASGVLTKQGTWEDTSADAGGNAAHYELRKSGGAIVMRGTVTATGGGGDMTVDNTVFAQGQGFTITSWTATDGNAGT